MLVKLLHFYIIEPETNWRVDFLGGGGGAEHDIEHRHIVSNFLPNLQLNIGKKKYLKTAIIIDESLTLAIVSRNYSTKPTCPTIFLSRSQYELSRMFSVFSFVKLNATSYQTACCGVIDNVAILH